jgi:hypothetical protein
MNPAYRNKDDWLKTIQTEVKQKMGDGWEELDWTPFVKKVAWELKYGRLIDTRIVDTLVASIAVGIAEAEDLETMPKTNHEFADFFLKNELVKKVFPKLKASSLNRLYDLHPKILPDDLAIHVQRALQGSQDARRESIELEGKALPANFKVAKPVELGQCMKFVNLENSINKLTKHVGEQYELYLEGKQSENFQWAACSGGPGLGKTTFCLKAFTKASEDDVNGKLWTDMPKKEQLYKVVRTCIDSGRQYRNNPLNPEEQKDLAWRLTQAVTKRAVQRPRSHDRGDQLMNILRTITKEKRRHLP